MPFRPTVVITRPRPALPADGERSVGRLRRECDRQGSVVGVGNGVHWQSVIADRQKLDIPSRRRRPPADYGADVAA